MINAILHIRKDLMIQLRAMKAAPDDVGGDNLRTLTAIRTMLDHEGQLGWWKNSGTTGNYYIPVDLLLTVEDLVHLETLEPRVEIKRVLNVDGTDYGVTKSTDENGDEVLAGTPIYADTTTPMLGNKAVHDIDGNQTGVAPMVFNEMPQWYGWNRK